MKTFPDLSKTELIKDTLPDCIPASLWRLSHSLFIATLSVWCFSNRSFQPFLAALQQKTSMKASDPCALPRNVTEPQPVPQHREGSWGSRLLPAPRTFVPGGCRVPPACPGSRCWVCKHGRGCVGNLPGLSHFSCWLLGSLAFLAPWQPAWKP